MKFRKAQTEIMGLVVIVMIMTVALLFVLFFMTRDRQDSLAKSFDEDLHSYNTISAVLQANTPCRSLKISDLLQECVSFDRPLPQECSVNGLYGHCEYAEYQIYLALNKSLDYINKEYRFYVYTESDTDNNKVNIGSEHSQELCTEGNKVSATQPIRYAGGDMFVTLDICER